MEAFFDVILFFSIYSFLGWVMETLYFSIPAKTFINRGFLAGCFCPIYGFGTIFIMLIYRMTHAVFDNRFLALFTGAVISMLAVTVLEYITGYLLEKIFRCRYWDYSHLKYNLHGYICLSHSLLWGLLSLVVAVVFTPIIALGTDRIPVAAKAVVALLLLAYFLFDAIKTICETIDLRKVIMNYANIDINKYTEKVLKYKRMFLAFPHLLKLNAGILNRDVRGILNDTIEKIKGSFKGRF